MERLRLEIPGRYRCFFGESDNGEVPGDRQ
jgi:hypothetical protein